MERKWWFLAQRQRIRGLVPTCWGQDVSHRSFTFGGNWWLFRLWLISMEFIQKRGKSFWGESLSLWEELMETGFCGRQVKFTILNTTVLLLLENWPQNRFWYEVGGVGQVISWSLQLPFIPCVMYAAACILWNCPAPFRLTVHTCDGYPTTTSNHCFWGRDLSLRSKRPRGYGSITGHNALCVWTHSQLLTNFSIELCYSDTSSHESMSSHKVALMLQK